MMVVPELYRKSSPAVASYQWTDLAEGTGMVTMYAGAVATNSGVTYRLSKDTWQAPVFDTQYNLSPTAYYNITRSSTDAASSKLIDLDFDTGVFNLPQILRGTMLSNIPIAINVKSSDSQGVVYVVMTIKKVGETGTVTTLATTTSNSMTNLAGTAYTNIYFAFTTLVPVTNIAQGEKIRITVQVYGSKTAGTGAGDDMAYGLCYDPSNAAIGAIGSSTAAEKLNQAVNFSQMRFDLAFRIDN
jgi:hypothetical protein